MSARLAPSEGKRRAAGQGGKREGRKERPFSTVPFFGFEVSLVIGRARGGRGKGRRRYHRILPAGKERIPEVRRY